MRDRAPSSNNRRPAPGALPRVPARAGADPHLAATLRCGAGRGASNPAGNGSRAGRAAGQRWSLYLQTRIQSTARTQAPLAPSRAGQCLAAPRACPAPAARPHGTAGPSPGACSGSVPTPGTASSLLCLRLLHRCACASSCTAVPAPPALPCLGWGGLSSQPQAPTASRPQPLAEPGQSSSPPPAAGAGGRQRPHPTAACRGLPVLREPLSLLHPRARGLSPAGLFIAKASAGRGRLPQDPGPAELPGRRGDGADAKPGGWEPPPVPATGGCWAGEEASPLLPRDLAAGGREGEGGAARP